MPCLPLEKYRNPVLFGLVAEFISAPALACLPTCALDCGHSVDVPPSLPFTSLSQQRLLPGPPERDVSHADSQVREGPSFPGFLFL